MKHKVKVTQVLRVETSTVIEIEAENVDDAIEAISNGEVDLPSASDDVWVVEHSSLLDEDYLPV